ncbi:type II secretion system protein GspM [Pararobbsia silviterrae]|uniref:Type II secretion system protein M n=1 Tax=Pararobbsia silviterrae TaxID=1792498 RepID=A0A494YCR5_9BURK|nr:type II secretion system protein M [Pararobbsia silviterrae]RKP58518.1 type II secretion system protein M [Pararobbsia silviterrae]
MKNTTSAQTWHAISTAIDEFWSAREPREKRLLTIGGIVLGVALFYSVCFAPAYEGRAELREALPDLRAQLAQMQAEAREARELQPAAQGVPPTGDALRQALTDSLGAHGLQAVQVTAIGNSVQVRGKNVPFGDWIGWLDDARKQNKVQVSEAEVTALDKPGQVDFDATLAPATSR